MIEALVGDGVSEQGRGLEPGDEFCDARALGVVVEGSKRERGVLVRENLEIMGEGADLEVTGAVLGVAVVPGVEGEDIEGQRVNAEEPVRQALEGALGVGGGRDGGEGQGGGAAKVGVGAHELRGEVSEGPEFDVVIWGPGDVAAAGGEQGGALLDSHVNEGLEVIEVERAEAKRRDVIGHGTPWRARNVEIVANAEAD